ncbi:hypothetical protein QTL95_26915 [Rhizobium sp. S152]|uniref:hypothetical protein n=1 Tax=Rhizobium sp. S152 TaxID=3055038 RepID=UPI0025A9BB59|nr:hypothetical protein [Rhizobium sp. S152]MDM9629520.1 hypothetical protein [Rhizobium sp. S152]
MSKPITARIATDLSAVSRRRFLGVVAVAAIPATATVAGPSVAAPMSAQERFDFHMAELKKAAEEIDPTIGEWVYAGKPGNGTPCTLVLTAYRRTGQYEGDGLYEAGSPNWNGKRTKYEVRLIAPSSEGQRRFEVSCPGERMHLTETKLRTFIGRRVA